MQHTCRTRAETIPKLVDAAADQGGKRRDRQPGDDESKDGVDVDVPRECRDNREHAGKRGELLEPFLRRVIAAQQPQQLPEALGGVPRPQHDAPPLLQPVRRRVPVGDPPVDVLQRHAQKGRLPLQLVRHQFQQRLHKHKLPSPAALGTPEFTGAERFTADHISEAIQFRSLDRQIWG